MFVKPECTGSSLADNCSSDCRNLGRAKVRASAEVWVGGQGHSPRIAGCRMTFPRPLYPSLPAAHPAQIQGRPTATVSPLRSQNSPSRLPAGLRPPALGSPQHSPQPVTQCPRPAIPLASAASAVTPPNVSAANLNGEAGGGTAGGLTASSPTSGGGRPDERKSEKVSAQWVVLLWHQMPFGEGDPSPACSCTSEKSTPSSRCFSSFCGKVVVNYLLCWD